MVQRLVVAGMVLAGIYAIMQESRPGFAQVFPPRSSGSSPAQPVPGGQAPVVIVPPQPQPSGPPGSITKTIPFSAIIGDPTKAFIQITNMQSPTDTNFLLGRGLAGRIVLERFTYGVGNGNQAFVHVNGLSNPPKFSSEGNEYRLQFVIPTVQMKTYYRDYTGEGDGKLGDVNAENVSIDVYITPALDQRRLPTFHAIRVVFTGEIKEPEKCTYFFDMIFPVNVCSIGKDYLKTMKPAVENGIRETLQHPQTRVQFEQAVWQFLRGELLMQAGVNPANPVQPTILQAQFQGTDYAVSYALPPGRF